MPFHVCAKCDRVSRKSMGDLKKEYGWTFTIIGVDEVAKCGDCNKIKATPPKK